VIGEEQTVGSARAPRWRIWLLVVLALAAVGSLLALVLTLSNADRQRDAALGAQRRSYDVMVLTRTLGGSIARAEASLGRYVISGDRALGQLYADEWKSAGAQLDRLDRITAADAGQQRSIDALRTAFLERGEKLDVIALSTRYGRNAQALARYYAARRAPALDEIARRLDGINDRERQLLDRRTTAAERSVSRSSRIAGILAVFGALLVVGAAGLGWITVRSLAEAAVAEDEADAARIRAAELAAAVDAATAELRAQEARLRQVQKMQAVGQLTGGIAHDFNNMLAVVTGGLELAQRLLDSNPAAARRHLTSAAEGANRAAALTRRLLAFSREQALKPEPLEPAGLIAGMRDLLDRTLGDAITVAFADDGAGWRVRADKVELENALLNLAVNARDAMNGRGELTVSTGAVALADGEVAGLTAGEYCALAVTDTGCGMTREVAERVFEPFFTTKEVGKGTGLGLSQVFGLARQLGGSVSIDTSPGRGTTVTMYLPRDVTEDSTAPVAVPTPPQMTPRSRAILVVEDDPRVLATTLSALAELGHRPRGCGDPLAVPALLDTMGDVDLIVSDVLMPRRTGPEMIAALPPRWRATPVLYVTGFTGEVDASAFEGRPVLRKPYTLAALQAALAEALAGSPDEPHVLAAE
jgi:signal transduction histidine kinase/CheY-like chemotaxis protein